MRRYTKEQLLFFLKKRAGELKKSPTIKDMNKPKYPCSSTYYHRFGSWNNALRRAGLKVNLRRKFDKSELVENLKQLTKELGRVPKSSDLRHKSWTGSYSTYRKYFGSWSTALKASGLKTGFTDLKRFSKNI